MRESWCKELRVVVPHCERSWIGSAITRYQPLEVQPLEDMPGVAAFVTTGTPADCALLAIQNLFPTPPDLVLSGINVGENSGTAFFMSSGTVGAALAASFCGVPAVALSVRTTPELRIAWIEKDYDALDAMGDDWVRIAEAGTAVVRDMVRARAFDACRLFSVNMPHEVHTGSERRIVQIARTRFNRIFRPRDDGLYEHFMEPCHQESPGEAAHESDWDVIRDGAIAIHPVGFNMNGVLPEAVREAMLGQGK